MIILPAILLFNNILGVCFDSRFSELRGVRVKFIYFMLLIMTALTIVLMVNVVGIIMVIAMLTLPAAVAGQFTRRLWSMMILSVLLSVVFTSTGLALSYKIAMAERPDDSGYCRNLLSGLIDLPENKIIKGGMI